MNERFTVRLRKAVHVFCAGHFITLTADLTAAAVYILLRSGRLLAG